MDTRIILRIILAIMYFISAILNGACAIVYAKDNIGITVGYTLASTCFLTCAILNIIIILNL